MESCELAGDIGSRPVCVSDAKGTTTFRYDENGEHRGLVTTLDTGLGGGSSRRLRHNSQLARSELKG
jgi:hypothetical protein